MALYGYVLVVGFRRWTGGLALGVALWLMYSRFAGHGPVLFPAVDWIRLRGMELWPGLLNAVGMLLLVFAWTSAKVPRRLERISVGLGAVLVIAYWLFPQHFMIERLSPPSVGGDTIPVVVDGVYDHRRWDRQGEPGVPILEVSSVLSNEQRLSAMAHGIGHGMALQNAEGIDDATARVQGRIRSTLWAVQRALLMLVVMGGVFVALLAALALAQSLRGRSMPKKQTAGYLVAVVLLLPPVVNSLMWCVGWMSGLPEVASGGDKSLVQAGMTIGAVVAAYWAGLGLSAAVDGEE